MNASHLRQVNIINKSLSHRNNFSFSLIVDAAAAATPDQLLMLHNAHSYLMHPATFCVSTRSTSSTCVSLL